MNFNLNVAPGNTSLTGGPIISALNGSTASQQTQAQQTQAPADAMTQQLQNSATQLMGNLFSQILGLIQSAASDG